MSVRPRVLPAAFALAIVIACGASETPDTMASEATAKVTLAVTGMT